jgi:two-component system, OmpR family, response regulator VanR
MENAPARASRDSILLIDDDQFVAGSLKQFLLTNHWDVDVAADPVAAEELLRSRKYGVIVVDPYLTGSRIDDRGALMFAARALQPKAAMIVLTGYGSSEMQQAAADCRAAVLTKPQSVIALTQAITSASKQTIREEL